MTLRINKAVDVFRDINNLNDYEIVQLFRKDRIDIAIDLIYTGDARPSLCSLRGSIQINYLGYPGTMGHEGMDYIPADKVLIQEKDKKFFLKNTIYE